MGFGRHKTRFDAYDSSLLALRRTDNSCWGSFLIRMSEAEFALTWISRGFEIARAFLRTAMLKREQV